MLAVRLSFIYLLFVSRCDITRKTAVWKHIHARKEGKKHQVSAAKQLSRVQRKHGEFAAVLPENANTERVDAA